MLAVELNGQAALVLGGARGIGAGIVETLARAGAAVFFTHTGDPRHAAGLAVQTAKWRAGGLAVEGMVADGSRSPEAARAVAHVIEARRRLDLLVVNLGKNLPRPMEKATDEEWREFLDINLSSAFFGVRASLAPMIAAGRGRIILIGSSVVFDGGGDAVDYASAKAGLVGMMRYLTRNYARRGILTNVVHPCVIETDLLRERYSDPEKRKRLLAQVPAGRLGRPEDIAGLVAFLASKWGDFICGQEFLVDGGRTAYGR